VQGGGFLIFLVAMFAIMYFLLIRPQRAKQRAAQDMLAQLSPGDEIVTIGGIYGDVVEVYEDKVVLEIAEDVHIEVARKAVAQIVQQDTAPAEPEDDDVEPADDDALPPEPEDKTEPAEPAPVREEKRWGGVFGRREG
jgi:preprotein translocase subunit YajC